MQIVGVECLLRQQTLKVTYFLQTREIDICMTKRVASLVTYAKLAATRPHAMASHAW